MRWQLSKIDLSIPNSIVVAYESLVNQANFEYQEDVTIYKLVSSPATDTSNIRPDNIVFLVDIKREPDIFDVLMLVELQHKTSLSDLYKESYIVFKSSDADYYFIISQMLRYLIAFHNKSDYFRYLDVEKSLVSRFTLKGRGIYNSSILPIISFSYEVLKTIDQPFSFEEVKEEEIKEAYRNIGNGIREEDLLLKNLLYITQRNIRAFKNRKANTLEISEEVMKGVPIFAAYIFSGSSAQRIPMAYLLRVEILTARKRVKRLNRHLKMEL